MTIEGAAALDSRFRETTSPSFCDPPLKVASLV